MMGPLFVLGLLASVGLTWAGRPERESSLVEVEVEVPAGFRWADLRTPHIGFAEGGIGAKRVLTVDPTGLARLDELGLLWRPVPPPSDPLPDRYHTPAEMVVELDALAERSGDRVTRVDLGSSVEGRPIVALRIANTAEPSAHIRVLGAHHGDELISAEAALELARILATEDGAVAERLEDVAVWVVPHVNPDGVEHQERHNANAVDLNRNYSYRWSATEFRPGTAPFSEPETRAIQSLTLRAPPTLGLSLHSGAANFGWVWNYAPVPSPDAQRHEQLADRYAELCTLDDFWVTNGAEWYPTNGDTNDWAYGYWGTFDYTVELSVTKTPDADLLDERIEAHLDALLDAILTTPLTTGQLVDAESGRPVRGSILRSAGGARFRTSDDGRFAVVLADPSEAFTITAPGYGARTLLGSELTTVPLDPEHRRTAAAVWPPVVRLDHSEALRAPAGVHLLNLWPPGRPRQLVDATSGRFHLRATGLPPGRWQVEASPSQLLPALLVDGVDAPAIVDRWLDGSRLHVVLDSAGSSDLTSGREAHLFDDGQLARVEILPDHTDELTLDLTDFSPQAAVDVAIHGPGGPVWIADVFDGAWTAAVSPPGTAGLDTGLQLEPAGELTACGCTSSPSTVPLYLWVVVVSLTWRRRP